MLLATTRDNGLNYQCCLLPPAATEQERKIRKIKWQNAHILVLVPQPPTFVYSKLIGFKIRNSFLRSTLVCAAKALRNARQADGHAGKSSISKSSPILFSKTRTPLVFPWNKPML